MEVTLTSTLYAFSFALFLFSFCNKPPSVLADFLVQQITQVSAFSMFHMKSMTSKKHNTICNTLSRIAPG